MVTYPKEWEPVYLKDIVTLITKGTTPTNKSGHGTVNFIKVENIDEDSGSILVVQKITLHEHEGSLRRSKLRSKDILFSIAGTLGRVATVSARLLPANTNQALAIIRLKEGMSHEFVRYYLSSSREVKDYILRNPTIGAQPNLSLKQVQNIKIPLPLLTEQQAIAETLSTFDKHIENLTKLIEKKKAIRDGALEEFVTGKTRLDGFDGEWEEIRIGDLFRVTRGLVLSTDKISKNKNSSYKYPVYSSQTVNNGLLGYYKEYLYEDAITWTTDGANAGDTNFRKGPFYCTNVCGVLINEEGYANHCIASIIDSISKQYVSYVGNPKLMNNVVSEIRIHIPSLEEQQAIASILTAMDDELIKFEHEREKIQQIKEGAMDDLLTGKIRLI